AAATIRNIARAAGIANGTVFVHFNDKEDLLYSAFYDDLQRTFNLAISTIPEKQSLEEQLYSIAESFLRTFASRPKLYRDFLDNSLLTKAKWGKKFRQQVE